MKQFNYDDFNAKSWSKRNALELKQYISHAVRDINRREYNDKVSQEAYRRLGEDITGFTKKGNLSARMVGKTKEELLFEARSLHNFLSWDYTSNVGKRELQNKYKESYEKFKSKKKNKNITQETYEIYVELMNAFGDLSKAYDSDQVKEWVEQVEDSEYLSYKDLQDAMLEYADELKDETKIKHKGLGETERANGVTAVLERLIAERTPKD